MLQKNTLSNILLEKKEERDYGITFIIAESDEEFVSYQALYEQSRQVLYYLQESGVNQGDEVIFQIDDNKTFIQYFWACILGGMIPVPITTGTNDEHKMKLFKIWKVLKNPRIVTTKDFVLKLNKFAQQNGFNEEIKGITSASLYIEEYEPKDKYGEIHEVKPTDIAFIQFSSGSTGEPKGVIITHSNVIINLTDVIKWTNITMEDRSLNWMPLTHDMGLIGTHIKSLIMGINQYNMQTSLFIRRPSLWIKKASEHKISLLYSPNFGYKHFLKGFDKVSDSDWDLSRVRLIFNGAEPISADLCNEFLNKMNRFGLRRTSMYPVYGLAEGTIAVTFPKLEEPMKVIHLDREKLGIGDTVREIEADSNKGVSFVDVGYPLYNCQLRICDEDNIDMGENRIGYIQIKGGNVTSGYYRNEDATNSLIDKEGWLNTGDLGYLCDGRLVITGRAKDIIFMGGQNFYSHDIERVAEELDDMELGKVVAIGSFNEEKQCDELIVFILFKQKTAQFIPLVLQIKEHINKSLGLDVAHVIPIDRIPKTTSGKVQRFLLRKNYMKGEYTSVIQEIEQLIKEKSSERKNQITNDEVENKLIEIWSEVLEKIGINTDDNFFVLGGNSLKGTLLISRIEETFSVEITHEELFNNSNIISQVALIKGKKTVSDNEKTKIEKLSHSNDERIPSLSQKRLWFIDNMEEESPQYNIYTTLRLEGNLNIEHLVNSLNKVVSRNELLSASFGDNEGEPVLHLNKDMRVTIPIVDMMVANEKEREEIVLAMAEEEAREAFNLEKAPLIRCKLYKINENQHILLMVAHHIIFDGWSFSILLNELSFYYDAFVNSKNIELPENDIQYSDFAKWQNENLKSTRLNNQLDYWRSKLSGSLPVLDLPTNKQRPGIQTYRGKKIIQCIPNELLCKLKELALQKNATPFMVLLSAFKILIFRYSGQSDVIVGTPVANRNNRQLEKLIGFFTNNLVLRTSFEGENTFSELLEKVRKTTLEAYSNQDVSYEKLVEVLNIPRDMSRNPIFQVLFSLQNTPPIPTKLSDLSLSEMDIDNGCSRFDLSVDIWERENDAKMVFEYNTDLFETEAIERIAQHYLHILSQIVYQPNASIDRLSIVTESERNTILKTWNSTALELGKENCWVELFENQVEKAPNAIAVSSKNERLTYKELNSRANQLANYFTSLGLKEEFIIGIYMERSVEMLIALLAVQKARCAYLPMDPIYPKDRISYMLENAKVSTVVTDSTLAESLSDYEDYNKRLIVIDKEWSNIGRFSKTNLSVEYNPQSLAYVIYTSGSTGNPKGVQIEQKALMNFLVSMALSTEIKENDALLAVTTLSFDISGLELYMPLIAGAEVVIATREETLDGELLINKIEEKNITLMQATPATWRLLMEYQWEGKKDLTILCGGEALSKELADKLVVRCKTLWNVYGPTETTIWSTMARISRNTEQITIGKPIHNTEIYVLDKHMNPVPVGIPGEMYIGGYGLARGYIYNDELTNEKFISNPFSEDNDSRLYRTGDLVKYLPDGNIDFLGRIDHQVKIRGFRIELGEIEALLSKHSKIKQAVVTAKELVDSEKALVAYIIPIEEGQNGDPSNNELRDYLKEKLPEYMIPSVFMMMDSFPMTSNGKIDRKLLPMPQNSGTKSVAQTNLSLNEVEKSLLDIWREVLHTDNIGINDSFFDLGGHSLLLTKVRLKIAKELKKDVSIMELFKYPTISTLGDFLTNDNKASKVVSSRNNEANKSRDIAVIGLSGRFPGADSVEAFWDNLCNSRNTLTNLSDEEIIAEGIDPDLLKKPHYVKTWGVLGDIEKFDANFFGYNPREATMLDPQQRIFLEESWKAMENAGYNCDTIERPVGVFASVGMNTYVQNLYSHYDSRELANNYQIMTSNDKDFIATRIAYKLNLKGPAFTVQTACSSSLVGIHLACQSLINNECDMALAGGVSTRLPQKTGYLYQEGMILSPDGVCRAFDESAKGTIGGNGAGVVVLKRLEEAMRDKDNVIAVIKGSAINNDGSIKMGYTAPSIDGQAKAITMAYENGNVDPSTITYIETHGTGTPLGDPIEIEALSQVFNERTEEKQYCAIGSVKTNIGHLDSAAGVSGFIKTVLALHHKKLPASLNYQRPNPKIDFGNSPFYVNTELKAWESSRGPLRAGVSSFGIGGTNAHAVLEEAPLINEIESKEAEYLLVLSAKTSTALENITTRLANFLKDNVSINMADVAYTMQVGRKEFEYRRYLVCTSREEAVEILEGKEEGKDKIFANKVDLKQTPKAIGKEDINNYSIKEIGDLWLNGAKIEWKYLHNSDNRRRIALPTYPFEGKKYWVDKKENEEYIRKAQTKERNTADWFYTPIWKQSTQEIEYNVNSFNTDERSLLVIAEKNTVSEQLTSILREASKQLDVCYIGNEFENTEKGIYTIEANNPKDYERLIKNLSIEKDTELIVVNLLGLSTKESLAEPDDYEFGKVLFYSQMYLAQAIGSSGMKNSVVFKNITNGMHRIFNEVQIKPEKALMIGPAKVIPREYSNIQCSCIDVLYSQEMGVENAMLELLAGEIFAKTTDVLVAYRHMTRFVQAYEQIKIGDEGKEADSLKTAGIGLKDNGTYIITGGFGGMGLILAKYLAQKVRARIVLVGRSELPDKSEWMRWISENNNRANRKKVGLIKKLIELESLGADILPFKADITDVKQLKEMKTHIEGQFGEINGIFHVAGAPGGGMIQMRKSEAVEQVLLPKVKGTNAIYELFADKVDFLLLYSSLNAITGGFGQVDYSSANAYLDAFATAHDNKKGTRVISINWDRWPGIGMAVNIGQESSLSEEEIHPLVGRCILDSSNKLVYCSELSPEKHWALSEHLVLGTPTIAGTTYLEMARAAVINNEGDVPLEISGVLFLAPMAVKYNESRIVFTTLTKNNDGYSFSITSKLKTGNAQSNWMEHSRGTIRIIEKTENNAVNINDIVGRCNSEYDKLLEKQQQGEQFIEFGARWKSLKNFYKGENEALVEVELNKELINDLITYKMHPALLDIATGSLRISADGNYLPFSYGSLMVFDNLPDRFYCHLKYDENNLSNEILSCNMDIVDVEGKALIKIDRFSMRLVNQTAANQIKAAKDNNSVSPEHMALDKLYIDTISKKSSNNVLSEGITAEEGLVILNKLLNSSSRTQVIVSTKNVDEAISQASYINQTGTENALAEVAATKVYHPRPELDNAYVSPKNETQVKLATIWQDLLTIDKVGTMDDFFQLGGDSLLMVQLHSNIKEVFETNLAVVDLYKYTTISALAKYLDNDEEDEKPSFDKVNQRVNKQLERRKNNALNKQRRMGVIKNG